ncbi:MAG: hypothetical protein ACJAXA_000845, partial [Candidatus Aldehydirespiratoraceae bacterium]
LIGISFVMPFKSEVVLDSTSQWLISHNRIIMIVLGSVFGTWFMVKALDGFGVFWSRRFALCSGPEVTA